MSGRSLSVAVIYNPVELGGDAVVRSVVDGAREAHDAITALGHRASLLRVDEGVRPFVEALERLQPDVVFNLCEGFRESSAGEFGIAALLDLLGIPYTGSGSLALAIALNKPLAKALFVARGIPTPGFAVCESMPEQMPALEFPWMLKLAAEDASLGITADNVVADDAVSRPAAAAALRGVPRAGPRGGVRRRPGVHGARSSTGGRCSSRKSSSTSSRASSAFAPSGTRGRPSTEARGRCSRPDHDDQREEMLRLAVDVAEAIGLRDYARVDFRMDARRPAVRARGESESRHQRRIRLSPGARRGRDSVRAVHRHAARQGRRPQRSRSTHRRGGVAGDQAKAFFRGILVPERLAGLRAAA